MHGLILVRHAEPNPTPPGDTSHWTDTDLSELGRRQAAAVAARLAEELRDTPCAVVSSDLRRASQTAEAIAAKLGVAVKTTPDLREYNNGSAIGGTEEALMKCIAGATAEAETWQTFYDRVSRRMQAIFDEQDRPTIVVSHYGAMINIVTWWLGLGLNDKGDGGVSFDALLACITVLRLNRQGKHTIERLNDTAHLREAGLGRPIQLAP